MMAPLLLAAALAAGHDPTEPPGRAPRAKQLPRPGGAIARSAVDVRSMLSLIDALVACGTRSSLSSWADPKRGIGCGRDQIVRRLGELEGLKVVVDPYEASAERTGGHPVHLENVYALLPGADPQLTKTVLIVSGHFDSRASDVMDAGIDAPGADDDGSGVAVSVEAARLLFKGHYRATLLFAAVSGEEQGVLGASRLLQWVQQQGYAVAGMLDDDIVGADPAPGGPHRVRLFSAGSDVDDADSPSRELARAVEEIDGMTAVRLVLHADRLGRGGDHLPFSRAGLPSVRFTEPLECYAA